MPDIQIDEVGYVATDRINSPVTIQFADGPHIVHEAIVAHLGGSQELLSKQGLFKYNTYNEFVEGFWKMANEDRLRRALGGVIANHLANFGAGR